jgi:hypothetical protein
MLAGNNTCTAISEILYFCWVTRDYSNLGAAIE